VGLPVAQDRGDVDGVADHENTTGSV
jgi:hypothetical protein